jgi:hypothetical protein
MTAEEAIRFLAHEAAWCRDRDSSESFCLLLPGVLRALGLHPMNPHEAALFRAWLKRSLKKEPVHR